MGTCNSKLKKKAKKGSVITELHLRRQSTAIAEKCPMYVMLFKNLLNLQLNEESDAVLENHQTYLKNGLIRPYKHGDRVIFYSHQWLDYDHPDPEGKQLKIFLQQCSNLRDGKFVSVQPNFIRQIVPAK